MKALKSDLARRVLQQAFYDRDLSLKLRQGTQFTFEGKTYIIKTVPKAGGQK